MTPSEIQPSILFEDAHVLVLSKPAGLLSQGTGKDEPNVVDWLRRYLDRHYVGLIHRLDRNVSGLMVVAKRSKAARRLVQALQEGRIFRIYNAWLIGRLGSQKRWSHRLLKDSKTNKVCVVSAKNRAGKEAVLSVRPLGYGMLEDLELTLAEFQLETGRSHQIRVQSAHEGFPLLGDPKYSKSRQLFKTPRISRPALHAASLTFPHPISGEEMHFKDKLPHDMQKIELLRTV